MAPGDHDISIGPHLFQESSLFLQLPREIRDLVYDNLFSNTHFIKWIVLRESRHTSRIEFSYPPPTHLYKLESIEPTWLLACKQIFFEARQQYFRKVCCIRIGGVELVASKSIDQLTFFALQHVRTLDITNLPVTFEQPYAGYSYLPMASSFLLHVPDIDASFEELRMSFTISTTMPYGSLDKGEGLEYSLFDSEQIRDMNFDKVEFIIKQPTIESAFQINKVVEIYSLLQGQLIDAAKILTDGHSKTTTLHNEGWSVQDWIEEEVEMDLRGNPNQKGVMQYSWHVKAQKKTRDQSPGGLTCHRLQHFVEYLQRRIGVPPERNHFQGIESSDPETISFNCVKTGETVHIKGGVVEISAEDDTSTRPINDYET